MILALNFHRGAQGDRITSLDLVFGLARNSAPNFRRTLAGKAVARHNKAPSDFHPAIDPIMQSSLILLAKLGAERAALTPSSPIRFPTITAPSDFRLFPNYIRSE